MCDEDTGMCTCAASLGYSGGENNKCDACLDGWIWTASDSTCTGKFFFFFQNNYLFSRFVFDNVLDFRLWMQLVRYHGRFFNL